MQSNKPLTEIQSIEHIQIQNIVIKPQAFYGANINNLPLNSRSAAAFPTSAPSLVLAKSNG